MKKIGFGLFSVLMGMSLVACGNNDEGGNADSAEDKTITVAAQLPTMTDIIEIAAEEAEEDGWDVQVAQVNDNVAYNDMVANEEADANFAQHEPFMEAYNNEKDADLVAIQPIYDVRIGFYSEDYDSIDEIPEGSTVAMPNDVSNEGRALAILQDQGLVELKEDVGYDGRLEDIEENPKNLEWMSVDLLNLPEAYSEPDVSLVYSYPAYIDKIGLKPKDAMFLENNDSEQFAIQLIAREDNKDSEKIQVLKEAMTSDKVREYLEDEEHRDTTIPMF